MSTTAKKKSTPKVKKTDAELVLDVEALAAVSGGAFVPFPPQHKQPRSHGVPTPLCRPVGGPLGRY